MVESLEKEEGDVQSIGEEVSEFLERFPDDPRAVEVQRYADELELAKLERRLRTRTRLAGGRAFHPAEQIYADALALADGDPSRAANMLAGLLALYPAAHDVDESVKQLLVLAERQLGKLREKLDQQAHAQLPLLAERLRTAKGLESVNRDQAAAMYEALINLFDGQPWAAEIVDEAEQRLNQMRSHDE